MTDTNQKGEGMYHLQYLQMDGTLKASANFDIALVLWDAQTGSHVMTLEHASEICHYMVT